MTMIASAMLTVALSGISASALAEGKISIAQQFGIGYLILDVVPLSRWSWLSVPWCWRY